MTKKYDQYQHLRYPGTRVTDPIKLQETAPEPPRYLIRVHSRESQGHMTSNTFTSAAEYHTLKLKQDPPLINAYDPQQLENGVHHHLTNFKGTTEEPFYSPFVSLTISLRTALAWAKMKSLRGHKEIRVAVLDTNTITTSNCDCGQYCNSALHQNPIWPADLLFRACASYKRHYPDEFLAFGHVRGSFKTCTFAELETTILNQYMPELGLISRNQRYEDLPDTLAALWKGEQMLHPESKELVIHIAKQLSNDDLLIPMVAFVLCIRRRSMDDKHVLDTIVKAARLVEKQTMYDFIGYFDAFPVIDFFSSKVAQEFTTAGSVELVQTCALLERVKLCFAELQEREAKKMWQCTTVALIVRYYCPPFIGAIATKSSLQSRRMLTSDVARSFSRLQTAVFRSKTGGLRQLKDALAKSIRGHDVTAGLLTPVSIKHETEREYWVRTFAEIATDIETCGEVILSRQPGPATVHFEVAEASLEDRDANATPPVPLPRSRIPVTADKKELRGIGDTNYTKTVLTPEAIEVHNDEMKVGIASELVLDQQKCTPQLDSFKGSALEEGN